MHTTMTAGSAPARRRTVGLVDVPLALFMPRRVYRRVEDVPAYGWPLVVLLTAVTLIGYATVETGLIDLTVARATEAEIARLESEQLDVVERSVMSRMIDEKLKEGAFWTLMARLQAIVIRPVAVLATVLLLAALLFGIVALSGSKPEWHTLMTVLVFAAFIHVVRGLVVLGLMLQFRTLDVNTSLAPLARFLYEENPVGAAAMSGVLSAFDPFRVWFWLLVGTGLAVTSQLRGWKVWASCAGAWLAAAGVRTALAVLPVVSATATAA